MAGQPRPPLVGASRTIPGTINALTVAYFHSPDFERLALTTRATYRGIIEAIRSAHGEKRVAMLQRDHISRMFVAKSSTPAAANNWLRIMRMLMRFAIFNELRSDDPTLGIKPFRATSEGFHTWTEDEISAFEDCHPIGTKPRLALALLLYTAQRRADVVQLGPQHVHQGVLRVRQQKTRIALEIPVHPKLKRVLDATPCNHLTYVTSEYGKPFTSAGFGNWFRAKCNQAGLQNCSAHGLRKAASRRLAEAGCTPHEIMAITGHKTLKEVTRYTAAADRARLARDAMAKTRTSSGKPKRRFAKKGG
jgi:integrase